MADALPEDILGGLKISEDQQFLPSLTARSTNIWGKKASLSPASRLLLLGASLHEVQAKRADKRNDHHLPLNRLSS
jgi:hypothetical protein